MDNKIPLSFDLGRLDATDVEPVASNPNFLKARVHAFYKGLNRNGSFIDDSVAEMLSQSAAGVPVVGLYDTELEDFSGHTSPEQCKAYGFVRENPNFAWENHLDEDGVLRTYAAFDVVLWAGYFEEANKIPGKSQSMELRVKDVDGHFAIIEDEPCFYYTHASMAAFCVLGDTKTPCFEGSQFYELEDFKAKIENLKNSFSLSEKGGTEPMPEEFENTVEETVVENEVENGEGTENYTEQEEVATEEVVATEETPVAEEEAPAEETPADEVTSEEEEEETAPASNYEDMYNEAVAAAEAMKQEYEAQIANLNATIESLTSERDSFSAEIASLKEIATKYEALVSEMDSQKKNELITTYSAMISSEEINTIKEKATDFSYEELEAQCALAFARQNIKSHAGVRVPLDDGSSNQSELAKKLSKYRK